MAISAQREQAKSAKISRGLLIAGCVFAVATLALAVIRGWDMICNIVAVVAAINLGFSLYCSYKADRLPQMKEKQ